MVRPGLSPRSHAAGRSNQAQPRSLSGVLVNRPEGSLKSSTFAECPRERSRLSGYLIELTGLDQDEAMGEVMALDPG
jgi:hypothetical protein